MKFKIVYADPPWDYWGSKTKNAAAGKHYKLMTLEEMAALPLREIMDSPAALFLWATCPKLDVAIDLIRAWKLHYRGVMANWVKCRRDGGIIAGQGVPPTFTKPTSELLLAATTCKRGRPLPLHDFAMSQVVLAPRGAHSAKPAIFRDRIVTLCGDVPRIELFAREAADGWQSWGAEAPSIDLPWRIDGLGKD